MFSRPQDARLLAWEDDAEEVEELDDAESADALEELEKLAREESDEEDVPLALDRLVDADALLESLCSPPPSPPPHAANRRATATKTPSFFNIVQSIRIPTDRHNMLKPQFIHSSYINQ